MKEKSETFVVISMFLVLLFPTLFCSSAQAQSQKGPRNGGLAIVSYASSQSSYAALKAGQIDIMAWPIDEWMYEDAVNDPNILLTPITNTYMIYGVNFNANKTINTYQGVWSPLSNETFRRAIAHLVDKNYFISNIFRYKAERIDVPIPVSQSNWWNTSVTYPNYPYEFDPNESKRLLNSIGFVDTDGNGIRNYPIDWKPPSKAGKDLDPIVFYVDCLDEVRVLMAENLRDQMVSVGIPVDLRKQFPLNIYNEVLMNHDYHIYMGYQAVNSLPVYLAILAVFVFMQASFGRQWAYADLWQWWKLEWPYPGIGDILEHVGLADLYGKLWTSQTFADAMRYSKLIQGLYTENAFEVPICSVKSYFAYRRDIAGIVNEEGYGLDNPYTYLNAYRVDNSSLPILVGLVKEPVMLNILYSIEFRDYQVLDKVYAGLIAQNPYDHLVDQPWVAQDWSVGSWFDPDDGLSKTMVTYYFRKDVYWVHPQNGTKDGLFNATDYEFTAHYLYAQYPFIPEAGMGCPHLDKFKDIHHIEIVNDFTVRVYMNVSSMWAYQWPVYPLLPKHVWLREPLAHNRSVYFGYSMELPGKLSLSEDVVSGSKDTKISVRLVNGTVTWLTYGQDFMWKEGGLYVLTDSVNDVKIDKILWVYYWANGDPFGYYPGDLSWQQILEGCGPYYVLNVDSQVVCLNPNRYFFLETPVLGEIDWRWNWQGTTKPRSGYYRIDVLDVVICTGSYCHRGDGIPDPLWFPGADIDPTDVGHVGILDIVTVTNNYYKTFGTPP